MPTDACVPSLEEEEAEEKKREVRQAEPHACCMLTVSPPLVPQDEPQFEGVKEEWWRVFRELDPIGSCLEVRLDGHSITPIFFNRKDALLTFIFDQRGELIIGVDGVIIQVSGEGKTWPHARVLQKGKSWYASEQAQVRSLEFRKLLWDKGQIASFKIVWKEEEYALPHFRMPIIPLNGGFHHAATSI